MSKTARRCRASARETKQRPAILPWLVDLPYRWHERTFRPAYSAAFSLSMIFPKTDIHFSGSCSGRHTTANYSKSAYSAREQIAREIA